MRALRTFVALLCLLPIVQALASDCVKVRDAKDGDQCMRFSKAEKALATKYGLSLGMKYQAAHSALSKSGWEIDRDWIKENSQGAKEVRPVCGNGYDAMCSISYAKEKRKVSLYLSGVNEGLPLTAIEEGY